MLSDNPTPEEVRDYYDLHTGEGTVNFSHDDPSICLWHSLDQAIAENARWEEIGFSLMAWKIKHTGRMTDMTTDQVCWWELEQALEGGDGGSS